MGVRIYGARLSSLPGSRLCYRALRLLPTALVARLPRFSTRIASAAFVMLWYRRAVTQWAYAI